MLKKPDLILMDFEGTIVASRSQSAHAAAGDEDVVPVAGLEAWLERFRDTPKWILSTAQARPIHSALERLRLSRHFERLICRTSAAPVDLTEALRGASGSFAGRTIWSFGDEMADLRAGIYVGAVLFLLHGPHNHAYRFLADFSLEDYTSFDHLGARGVTEGLVDGYLSAVKSGLDAIDPDQVGALAAAIGAAAAQGRTVFVAGNGGCHAIASHFAADVRRSAFVSGTRLMVYVLGDNAETVSALGNDLGFQHALWNEASTALSPGDLIVILSTSGSSANLVALGREGAKQGAVVHEVNPHTVLAKGALGFAQLNEDVLSAFCHMASFAVRRSLLRQTS